MAHLLVLLILIFSTSLAKAFENCTDDIETLICEDYGSSIGYCCDSEVYFMYQCCYYTAWWGRWYFYFGIVFGLGLLSVCAKCCANLANPSNTSPPNGQINPQTGISVALPPDDVKLPTYEQASAMGKGDEERLIISSDLPSYGS